MPQNSNPKKLMDLIFIHPRNSVSETIFFICHGLDKDSRNNKKRSHTQLDSRKQVIAFQDRVMTINIKEAQHPLK